MSSARPGDVRASSAEDAAELLRGDEPGVLLVGPAAQTGQAIRLILSRLSDRAVMPVGFAASGATPEMLRQEVAQAHAARRSADTDLLLVVAQADRLSPDLLHELEMAAEAAAAHGGLKFLFAAPRDLTASLQRAGLWSLAACVRTCLPVPPAPPGSPPAEQPGRDTVGRAGQPYPFDLLVEPLGVARHAQQAGPGPRIMLAVGILVVLGLALTGVLVEHQPNRSVMPAGLPIPVVTAPTPSLPGPPASAPPMAAPPVDSFETPAPPTAAEPAGAPPAPAPSAPVPSAPSSSPPASVSASPAPVPTQQPADAFSAVPAPHSSGTAAPDILTPGILTPGIPAPATQAPPTAAVPAPPASSAPPTAAASAPPPASAPASPAAVPPQADETPVVVPAGPTPSPVTPPPGGIGMAGIVPQMAPAPHASLLLLAGPADTLSSLYAQVYRGTTPPPYAQVVTLNPVVRSGVRLVFPAPPAGWPPASPP